MGAWVSPLVIIAAGAFGGLVNAMMTQNGFVLPDELVANGGRVWRPGIIGNIVVSAVAALVSWGLYGAGAAQPVFSTAATSKDSDLTYAAVVGAILVGIGGARWLTSEVDKNLLRAAAVAAANEEPSQALAKQLAISTPAAAFSAAAAHQ